MSSAPFRCPWCLGSPAYLAYHDEEWGRPCHDETTLFEFLNLEGAQAGLSWSTILAKRASYRQAFDGWDAERIAAYGEADVARLLANPGIVRNRLKVNATLGNAQAYLRLRAAGQTLDSWLWAWVDGQPRQGNWTHLAQVPARTELSDDISKSLKKQGFKFVGSTIIYAWLQAMGVVNDHLLDCFRHPENSDAH